MAISEEQISKLIKAYEGYREVRLASYTSEGTSKAQVYGAVIDDLKELLPRETLADVAGDDLRPYVGTWVEYLGQHALVLTVAGNRLLIVSPKQDKFYWRYPNEVHPLDASRAWDEDGDLAIDYFLD